MSEKMPNPKSPKDWKEKLSAMREDLPPLSMEQSSEVYRLRKEQEEKERKETKEKIEKLYKKIEPLLEEDGDIPEFYERIRHIVSSFEEDMDLAGWYSQRIEGLSGEIHWCLANEARAELLRARLWSVFVRNADSQGTAKLVLESQGEFEASGERSKSAPVKWRLSDGTILNGGAFEYVGHKRSYFAEVPEFSEQYGELDWVYAEPKILK